MHYMKTLSIALTFIGFLLFYNQSENKPETVDEPAAIGFVQTTKGSNYLIRNGTKQLLTKQMEIYSDDEIFVGVEGFSKVNLAENNFIAIGPQSLLKVSFANESFNLKLQKGKIRGQLKLSESHTVSTPNAEWLTAASDFILTHELDESNLSILKGSFNQKESLQKTISKQRIKVLSNLAQLNEQINDEEFSYLQGMLSHFSSPNTMLKTQWTVATSNRNTTYYKEETQLSPEEARLRNIIRDPLATKEEKEAAIQAAPLELQASLTKTLAKHEGIKKLKKSILPLLQNEDKFNQLDDEQKAEYLNQYQAHVAEQVSQLQEQNQALPLKTEDGRLVYFDDHPELKDDLPKDSEGNILSILVDDNFELVGSISTESSNFENHKIPVVNQHGEIELKSLVNEQNLVALMPIDPHSEFRGVNLNKINNPRELEDEPEEETRDEREVELYPEEEEEPREENYEDEYKEEVAMN